MKRTKKLLGFFLSLAVVVGLLFSTPITAEAYTYKIKISLGNNNDASFNTEQIEALKDNYTVDYFTLGDGTTVDNRTLEITGLEYNQVISGEDLNLDKLISLPTDKFTTYYVKGLKQAGDDGLVDADKIPKKPNIKVVGEQTYVVAYGVGQTVPYLVRYVDGSNNKLIEDEILYGAAGEVVIVPARYIAGYKADHALKTNKNQGGLLSGAKVVKDENGNDVLDDETKASVFTFVYSKYDAKVIYNEDYEYQTVYSEETTSGTEGGTTVIDRRGQNGGQGGGNAGGGNAGAAAGEGDNGGGAGEAVEPAPAPSPAPDIVDIADEDVARAGGEPQDNLVRNMIVAIIIAIVAVLAILIALIVADRKRKAQIANTNRKDDNE